MLTQTAKERSMRHRHKLAVVLGAILAASSTAVPAALARGGGNTPPPPPSGPPVPASVVVTPTKIALGATGTGTVTLSGVATADVSVAISDDYQNSPAVATMPPSVIVPAGSRSASFPIRGGDYPGRTFLVHLSTSRSGVTTQFYRTPLANTDIITITNASQSQSGDLRFTATSDTPSAQLTASFNGFAVPLASKGNGVWEGRGQVGANQSGEIQVTSNLQACSAKNPLTPTGWHFC